MLTIDTGLLLAVLTPEVHFATAAAVLAQARAPLTNSSWSVTELHAPLASRCAPGQSSSVAALSRAGTSSGSGQRSSDCLNGPGGRWEGSRSWGYGTFALKAGGVVIGAAPASGPSRSSQISRGSWRPFSWNSPQRSHTKPSSPRPFG